MAQEPYSSKGPLSQIALAPTMVGLALMLLGILMVAYPERVVHILAMLLAVLLGIGVLAAGILLLLVGLDLWRGASFLRRNVKIPQWRIWPGDKD